MKIFFDDNNDFYKDLDNLVAKQDRYDYPIIVVPTDKDAIQCGMKYSENDNTKHIRFISYDYWLSKKWIVDGDYDHIDFFRADQFFMKKCYDVPAGVATFRRIMKKKEDK